MSRRPKTLDAAADLGGAFASGNPPNDVMGLAIAWESAKMEFWSIYSKDAKERKQSAYRTLDLLISDDDAQSESAFQRVKNWDSRAVPAFLEIFLDSNESIERREQAALVLDMLAQREALPSMIEALKWPEPRLRAKAAEVLGSIGSPEAREALLEAARDKEPSVKQAAELALSGLLTKKRQKFLMAKLGERFNYNKPEDWYQLSKREVQSVVGSGILNQYNGSVAEMVMALVEAPEGGWVPWQFSQVPDGFWDNEENQKAYMKWLGEKIGYTKSEDWYGLTQRMIKENSGSGLLTSKFDGSVSEMVGALVEAPEGGWKPWMLRSLPGGFWDDEANQKAYMKWLGEKLGFSKSEDWYGLTQRMIKENSGTGLLTSKFDGSVSEMVGALVEAPEGGWKPWFFTGPKGFWDQKENQKAYMKWLGEKLGFRKPEDWYGLTGEMIRANSGTGLLQKFNGSVSEMILALVEAPEGGWKPWMLRSLPRGFWDDEANQKAYMKWLGEKLGYTKPEDWYLLTQDLIQENSGNGLLQKFNGSVSEMVGALVEAPEGGWKLENFLADDSKMEGRMRDILSRWFNRLSEPSYADRKTHGLKFKESGRGMGADVLFEEFKFAVEYHNNQHYEPIKNWGGQAVFEMIQKQDQETQEAFKNAGYIYIEIPHFKWAGGSEAVLKNLILEQLQEYEASSDAEVKARAARIRGVLQIVSDGDCETEKR